MSKKIVVNIVTIMLGLAAIFIMVMIGESRRIGRCILKQGYEVGYSDGYRAGYSAELKDSLVDPNEFEEAMVSTTTAVRI